MIDSGLVIKVKVEIKQSEILNIQAARAFQEVIAYLLHKGPTS